MIKTITTALLLLLACAYASGGTQGHGGLTVVCRDSATRAIDQSRLQMLDLKEGQAIYGLLISKDPRSADQQIQKVLGRVSFDPILMQVFQAELDKLRRGMEFTSPDVGLERLPDVSLVPSQYLDKDCKIEQVAIYTPEGKLRINSDLYNKFDNQNLAALFVHEVIYKMNRTSTAVDRSVEAREMTARLFADKFDFAGFKRLAEKKLPTLSNRLGNGKIKLQLRNTTKIELVFSGLLLMDGATFEVSTLYGDNFRSVEDCHCGFGATGTHVLLNSPIGDEMPYTVIRISNVNKSVSFKQSGQKLADDSGKTSFKISAGGTEFVLVPPK